MGGKLGLVAGVRQLQFNGLHFAWRTEASGILLHFNMFFKNLEETTESTVAMFAHGCILRCHQAASGLGCHPKGTGQSQEQASMNFLKFNKDKYSASGKGGHLVDLDLGLPVWVAALLQRLWAC